MITLTLPPPPSANNLFANKARGRYRTKRYMTWRRAAGWCLKQQKQRPIQGPVDVVIMLAASLRVCKNGRPKNVDLDNRAKAVLDLLVTHGLIDGDHKVESLFLQWCDRVTGCKVGVQSAAAFDCLATEAA